MNNSIIAEKSKAFAVRIVNVYKYLCSEKKEYVLSKQLLKSGTSIGANVKESLRAQSKADFIAKNCIAIKEASETEYWIELLYETDYLSYEEFNSLNNDNLELIKMLTAIINTAKENLENQK